MFTGITQTKLKANGYTGEVTDIQISGTPTLESALPKMGKVVYHGDAFNERTEPVEGTIGYGTSPGSLEYTIDFDERTGHGKISSLQLDFGDIMLRQGKLEKNQSGRTGSHGCTKQCRCCQVGQS